MRHLVATSSLALALIGLPGCFFPSSINERPQAQIDPIPAGNGSFYKGQRAVLHASSSFDPDGDDLTYVWRAYRCDERGACTEQLEHTSAESRFDFPITTKAPIDVRLEVRDPQGAFSRDSYTLVPVNRGVELTARAVTATDDLGGYVVGRTIEIHADVVDPDGDDVTLDAVAFAPKGSAPGFAGFTELARGRWRLVPDEPGAWLVEVHAVDDDPRPLGETVMVPITINADRDPCLAAAFPAPTTEDAPLLLLAADGPRAIQVTGVRDDLDPYPEDLGTGDVLLGRPHFRWLYGEAGGPLVELAGSDLPELTLDPEASAPGAELIVRVELADRRALWPTCDSALDSCGPPECRQRATWHVSVR